MKKLSISMLLLAAIALTVPSCKKGEEDPGLSLKSRSGRLAGEWNVTAYESVDAETDNTNDVTTSTTTHSGSGNMVTVTKYSFDTDIDYDTVQLVSETVTFDKEGTYSMERIVNSTETDNGVKTVYNYTITTTGTWQFLGKSGDYKNKERIALIPSSVETEMSMKATQVSDGSVLVDNTSTNVENSPTNNSAITFDIIRLSGDEIIMESNYENDTKSSSTGGSTVITKNSVTEKYTLTAAGE